jgi:3-dehydroquinate synthetase
MSPGTPTSSDSSSAGGEHAPSASASVRVRAASRSYEVIVGSGLLASIAEPVGRAVPGARRALLVVDAGVPEPAAAASLIQALRTAGVDVPQNGRIRLRPSEADKNLPTMQLVVRAMSTAGLERNDVAVVLGGGVLGDVVGFAAASYRRGMRWINCPSTLLAMVDASVGGKTGVNLRVEGVLQKNMVGAFWQPSLVVADVGVLASLPERVYRAGLAECIKHGMLSGAFGDAELGHWTRANLGAIGERRAGVLVELVSRNVAVKARVVAGDEREESADAAQGRALLNLGHTFGHAIETLPRVSPSADATLAPLQHGEAVALGLVCAMRCAELMKLVGPGNGEALERTLKNAGLPTRVFGLPPSGEIYERMLMDKKSTGGKLRLVLPVGEGVCRVVDAPVKDVVMRAVDAIRQ